MRVHVRPRGHLRLRALSSDGREYLPLSVRQDAAGGHNASSPGHKPTCTEARHVLFPPPPRTHNLELSWDEPQLGDTGAARQWGTRSGENLKTQGPTTETDVSTRQEAHLGGGLQDLVIPKSQDTHAAVGPNTDDGVARSVHLLGHHVRALEEHIQHGVDPPNGHGDAGHIAGLRLHNAACGAEGIPQEVHEVHHTEGEQWSLPASVNVAGPPTKTMKASKPMTKEVSQKSAPTSVAQTKSNKGVMKSQTM